MPDVPRTAADLRRRVADWRSDGLRVGLVPTMGALHDGHLSLIGRARERCDRVIVSVFVNPTQFAPHEDLDSYPRDEAGDRDKLRAAGTDLMYAPAVAEMYPPGERTRIAVGGLGTRLEGRFRPGFFGGVATVVTKLLVQTLPDVAVFGEKDYQQLLVIRRLTADLCLPAEIDAGPTVREADGLAMSSRNAYLTAGERAQAPILHQTLVETARRFRIGEAEASLETWACGCLVDGGFRSVDYFTIRDAETLDRVDRFDADRPCRVLAAAHLGHARLIDNIAV